MNLCTRCGRKLKHATPSGMGRVCEIAVLGPRPKAVAARRVEVSKDTRTADLFAFELEAAQRVESLLSGISLEMA